MNTAAGCARFIGAAFATLAKKTPMAHHFPVQKLPALLADNARTLVQASRPEVWRTGDGATRVLGPMNPPFEFLYVMLLGGSDAADRARGFSSASGSFSLDGFLVISDLTDDVGRPALLVERRPDIGQLPRAPQTASDPGSAGSPP